MNNYIQALFYQLVVIFCHCIIHTFFRDIKTRGSFNIPKQGPVIFVIGPHHNQFLDASITITKVKQVSGRQVLLLIAAASYRRRFIGFMAKLAGAIPVERAQDLLRLCSGTIRLEDNSNCRIIGNGTKFTQDCSVKGLIGIPNSKGNFVIEGIQDDTHLTIRPLGDDEASNQKKDLLSVDTKYKVAPYVDNHSLFQNIFEFLNGGNVLGLFPEGGSHDRTDLLPLKPGVAIMALGAMAQNNNEFPNDVINIVPVGMNYFHPHKFRSRCVIEFGEPIKVTKEMGERYSQNNRQEVNKLLDYITLSLKEVAVTCDDYETLMVLQTARRLFTNGTREKIPLPLVIEMNRRFVKGYGLNKNKPDIISLRNAVLEYQNRLMVLGLHDHQVNSINQLNFLNNFTSFVSRLFTVLLFFSLSLPGVVLFSPVFIISKKISKQKQAQALANSTVKIKAIDVLGTWKVLVALVIAPCLYIFWSILGTVTFTRHYSVAFQQKYGFKLPLWMTFFACYVLSVLTTYASLRIGEIGMDYYKSLLPLFYSLISEKSSVKQIQDLKDMRNNLSEQITEFCNGYGPDIFEDYQAFYNKYNHYETDHGDINLNDVLLLSDDESGLRFRDVVQTIHNAYKTKMKVE